MNKLTVFLIVVVTVLSFCLGSAVQCKAQAKSYAGIIPFVVGSDRIGLLDQNTGKIYVYDNNISQCIFTGQIQNLGQPIASIGTNSGNNSNSTL
ncbi:MAG: hypothetical protein HQL13_02015 [Candidatus Omnitrophica bacterium]|nr:hypothetical protein [Candidatus Omnitrophota bacterium]